MVWVGRTSHSSTEMSAYSGLQNGVQRYLVVFSGLRASAAKIDTDAWSMQMQGCCLDSKENGCMSEL